MMLQSAEAAEEFGTSQQQQVQNLLGGEEETGEEETGEEETGEEETGEEETGEEETGEEETGEEETGEIETIGALAEALELPPEELYALKVPIANGDPVSLGELKDAYQEQQAGGVGQSEREAFAQEVETVKQDIERQKQEAAQYAQQAVQVPRELQEAQARVLAIESAYQNTNWAELEVVDPGDAALQRQKLTEAYQTETARVGQMQQLVAQQQEQYHAQQRQQAIQQVMQEHPEWRDPQEAKKADTMMTEYLGQFGFQPQELSQIADPRIIKLVYDAAKKASAVAQSESIAEKVKKKTIGTLTRGALRGPSKGSAGKKLNNLLERGKKSNRIEDKAAAVTALLEM